MALSQLSRALFVALHPLAAVCLISVHGCSDSNEPSVSSGNSTGSGSGSGGAAPSTSTGGAGSGATAGQASAAGSGATAGQASAAGSSSTAGSNSAAGSNSTAGSTASAGTGATAGTGSTAGTGGEAGAMGGEFSPLCSEVPPTAAGAPSKGVACSATDAQLCYKTCGPQSVGFKSETCTSGAYVEQSGCSFPDGDYSCYKIPTAVDATCPTAVPQATMPCEVAMCVLCNVGGNYLDSSGASKAGYCVCPMAGAAGSRKWSCASTTAWPCPLGQGC